MSERRQNEARARYVEGEWYVPIADVKRLSHALWDCMVAAGADVSGYCPGGPSDPLWSGTPEQALDAGWDQWARMRTLDEQADEAVDAVLELRNAYDEEPES